MVAAPEERIFIGLGSNMGPGVATLEQAVQDLQNWRPDEPGGGHLQLVATSPWYRSAPVQAQGPDFINGVTEWRTTLQAHQVLQILQTIEHRHGRQRPYPNAPRTLDLDLLLWGQQTLSTPELTVPHPRMHLRAFVLRPLADLAPDLTLPGLGALEPLLRACQGQDVSQL